MGKNLLVGLRLPTISVPPQADMSEKTQAQIDAKKAYQAKWRAENAEKRAADNRAWRAANAEELKLKSAAYNKKNAEEIKAKNAAKYLANAEAERQKRVEYRKANAEKLKVQARASYLKHREVVLARAADYREREKDAIAASKARNKAGSDAYAARYRAENAEAIKARSREWHAENPEVRVAANAKRRAVKRSLTPNWDVELTNFVAKEAAKLAKDREALTGFRWDVDHVVPLQGKHVSGFHVWNNLAVIPAVLNRRKSNSFSPQPQGN